MSHPAPGALLDALGCVAFECDAEGRFTFLNPFWERLTGYRVEESLGRGYVEFAAPDVLEAEMAVFAEAIAARRAVEAHEGACIAKDGRRIWVEVHAEPQIDDAGNLLGMRGTLVDVTARRELQAKERQRDADARLLLDCSAALQRAESNQDIVDAVAPLLRERLQFQTTVLYAVDVEDGRMNLVAVAGTGADKTRERLAILPIDDDPGLQEMQRTRAPVHALADSLPARFAEAGLVSMVGVPLWSLDQALGMLGAGSFAGEPTPPVPGHLEKDLLAGIGVHAGMATSRTRLLAERERQRQRDQHVERRMSESRRLESLGLLAGGIAHDFNNVLVGILGNASLIRGELAEEHPLHDAAEDICVAAQHAARLAGRLLTYSGGKLMERGSVALNKLIEETVPIVAAGVPKTTCFIVTKIGAPATVYGNSVELQQVLMNLLTNASEAAVRRPVTVEVSARAEVLQRPFLTECVGNQLEPGEYALLEVSDDGHGIDPKVRANMFDPFVSNRGSGRGFGLASVLGIARAHAGALHVAERAPCGTKFSIILPLSEAAAPISDEAPHAVRTRSRSDPSRRRALVVDDEPLVRAFLRRILEADGFEVTEAEDGEEALAAVERQLPAFIVLDMSMPKLGGAAVRSMLRQKHRDLPIVLASGYSVDDAELSSDSYTRMLQKPYSVEVLRATIRELLGH